VRLHATYDIALKRVSGDSDGILSRHPDLLRRAYKRAEHLLPTMPVSDWTFDTDNISSQAIVDELTKALL
jgi:hypothetical protein